MKHSEYVEVIKKTATDIGVKIILRELLLEVPFLFWGPVGPLTKLIVTKVVTKAFHEGEMAIFFQYIDMRTDLQGRRFSQAAINNAIAQRNGTPDEKKKAEAELILAFKSFVKLSN